MRPSTFPDYPKRLDSRQRLRIRIHGKDYYLPKPLGGRASIAEYERLRLAHAQGSITPAPKMPNARGMTVSELIAAWLKADPRGMDDKEVKCQARACAPLEALFGSTPAGEFTTIRLRALQEAMVSGSWQVDGKPWNRKYINASIARVLRMFKWAESQGHVPEGRYAHLRTLAMLKRNDKRVKDHPPRRPVDWALQVAPCLKFMAPQVAAMVTVQYYAGMRPGEVCAIRRLEVDMNGPMGTWLYSPGKHKGSSHGRELTKVIGPKAQAAIAPWLLAAEPDGFVFPTSKMRYSRGCYLPEGYARAIARAVAMAKVEPWSPYSLRHGCRLEVTRAFGLDAARAVLGHSSLAMAADYAKGVDVQTAAAALSKIG